MSADIHRWSDTELRRIKKWARLALKKSLKLPPSSVKTIESLMNMEEKANCALKERGNSKMDLEMENPPMAD
jgi:hypothetical protein|tara:strand:+ start:2730 stop:2945 length:216 start_codon:yes stop_codon:yes gene_type:complete